MDINAKNARRILAAIEERLNRRQRATTKVVIVHRKEVSVVKAALEKFAADLEANIQDEKIGSAS